MMELIVIHDLFLYIQVPIIYVHISALQWKNCLQVYPYWQDFEASVGRMCHSHHMLLESLFISAW